MFPNTESQVLLQTFGRCISKAPEEIPMQPIQDWHQGTTGLHTIDRTFFPGHNERDFFAEEECGLAGLPLYFFFFLLYLNLKPTNVVCCLHSFSVPPMALRAQHTDATWEHNPFPDQRCQSRTPASLEMTGRNAHVNAAHRAPTNMKHNNFSSFSHWYGQTAALYAPLLSCLICNDFVSQNECFFISALVAEGKARWTSHLRWTKHINTFATAVGFSGLYRVKLMSLFLKHLYGQWKDQTLSLVMVRSK